MKNNPYFWNSIIKLISSLRSVLHQPTDVNNIPDDHPSMLSGQRNAFSVHPRSSPSSSQLSDQPPSSSPHPFQQLADKHLQGQHQTSSSMSTQYPLPTSSPARQVSHIPSFSASSLHGGDEGGDSIDVKAATMSFSTSRPLPSLPQPPAATQSYQSNRIPQPSQPQLSQQRLQHPQYFGGCVSTPRKEDSATSAIPTASNSAYYYSPDRREVPSPLMKFPNEDTSVEPRGDYQPHYIRPPQLYTIQSGDNSSIGMFSEDRNSEWRNVPMHHRLAAFQAKGRDEPSESDHGGNGGDGGNDNGDCSCERRPEEEIMREERNARLWDEYSSLYSQYEQTIQNYEQLKRKQISVNNRISEMEKEKKDKEVDIQNTKQLIAKSSYSNVGIMGDVLFSSIHLMNYNPSSMVTCSAFNNQFFSDNSCCNIILVVKQITNMKLSNADYFNSGKIFLTTVNVWSCFHSFSC